MIEYKEKLKEYLDKREETAIMINEEMAEGYTYIQKLFIYLLLNDSNNQEILRQLSKNLKDNLAHGIYGDNNIDLYCEDFNSFLI